MSQPTLNDLFFTAARKMVDGERRLIDVYPRFAEAFDDAELSDHLTELAGQAGTHADRMDGVLNEGTGNEASLDNLGVDALIREADAVINAYAEGPLRDAALTAVIQHIEHYKIACYGTLSAYAEALDNDDYRKALAETLTAAQKADDALTDKALTVNKAAV